MVQLRNSNQRKLILEIMSGNYRHPTADQIYEHARSLDPHISRGTVYRNLALLSDQGEINKIVVPNGPDHYDCMLNPHYHFCCSRCGKMFDAPDSITVEIDAGIKEMKLHGFSISGHSLILTGKCPECNGE